MRRRLNSPVFFAPCTSFSTVAAAPSLLRTEPDRIIVSGGAVNRRRKRRASPESGFTLPAPRALDVLNPPPVFPYTMSLAGTVPSGERLYRRRFGPRLFRPVDSSYG